jgi:hypothetical protein
MSGWLAGTLGLVIGALAGALAMLWWLLPLLLADGEDVVRPPALQVDRTPVVINVDAPWLTFLLRSVGAEVRWPPAAGDGERVH